MASWGSALADPVPLDSRPCWGVEESVEKTHRACSGELAPMTGLSRPEPPGLPGLSDLSPNSEFSV